MFGNLKEYHKTAIDDILKARHTVRDFSPDIPSNDEISAIIQSGLIAPFAALAVAGKPDFRKIIVIPTSSPISPKVQQVIQNRLGLIAADLEKRLAWSPLFRTLNEFRNKAFPD
jgi:hypothetical protein